MDKISTWIKEIPQCNKPGYVFDLDIIRGRVCSMQEQLKRIGVDLCFAMKANPFLVEYVEPLVSRIEVCSPGEYEICIKKQIPTDKIVVSGVNKTYESMDRIVGVSKGRGIYTIESPLHLTILEENAKKHGVTLSVIIRLSSGNQFGVDEATFMQLVEKVSQSEVLQLVGVHYYSGTQKKLKKIEKELNALQELKLSLEQKYGITNLELEYGPSLMSYYFQGENDTEGEQFEELVRMLGTLKNQDHGYQHITIEMGRYIASSCGYFLSQVVDVKYSQEQNYLIMDSGMHQLNYYGQMLGMKLPYYTQWNAESDMVYSSQESSDEVLERYCACGSLCTSNDILVRNMVLRNVAPSDTIVFERCGAYSVTEGIALFLSRELPAIYVWDEENGLKQVRELLQTHEYNVAQG